MALAVRQKATKASWLAYLKRQRISPKKRVGTEILLSLFAPQKNLSDMSNESRNRDMKHISMTRLTLACALAAAAVWAQRRDARVDPRVQVTFDGVDLIAAGADHLRFEVRSHVTAAKNVTVTRVSFERMRLGSAPFYLSPIAQRLELKSGQPQPLPSIGMTIYFRDVDSPAPLEEAIRTGQIRITGDAFADVALNLLEKIALHQWTGRVAVPLDCPIEVALPGGPVARAAALVTIHAAQAALDLAGSALHSARIAQKEWNEELKVEFAKSVVLAESRYQLRMSDGQFMDVVTRGVGFRISREKFILTGALVEPWKYDPETAALLDSKRARLEQKSFDVLAWPNNGPIDEPASISNGRIRIEKIATKIATNIVPAEGAGVRVPIARLDSDTNYAILVFNTEADFGPAMPSVKSQPGQTWERVAVFRMTEDGSPELIFLPMRREADRLIFDDPVDDGAFGSPVMTPDGTIGMLQNASSAMVVRSNW
jgi:hypothetical protein